MYLLIALLLVGFRKKVLLLALFILMMFEKLFVFDLRVVDQKLEKVFTFLKSIVVIYR